jgi:CheY-like chemotaxis protein
MKIAIIEDSQFMRSVTILTLRQLYPAAEIFEYADAGEALRALRKVAPDLITLDLLMPGIGGLEFLKRAKSRKIRAHIVVITANVQPAIRRRCINAGAHAFVEKPISLAKLRDALRRFPAVARSHRSSTPLKTAGKKAGRPARRAAPARKVPVRKSPARKK